MSRLLDAEDPRAMMRTQEPLYDELGLDTAGDEALIDAMARTRPKLIERPIVIRATTPSSRDRRAAPEPARPLIVVR